MPTFLPMIFLAASAAFALVHSIAIKLSLYWYYSWFDIVMHLWGGILIAAGVQVICGFKQIPYKPTFLIFLTTLIIVIGAWELFERLVGLYDPDTYLFDVGKDLLVGLIGGLVGYYLLRRLRM